MSTEIKYVGPDSEGVILCQHDDRFVCLPGEPVAVDDDLANSCLEQPANWALVQSTPAEPAKNGPPAPPESLTAPGKPPVAPEPQTAPATAVEAPAAPVKE